MTSAVSIALMSCDTSTPIAAIPRGISGGGPTSVTCAPISVSAWMFERATRECSDVADDGDMQAPDAAQLAAHRVEVEQALRRMLVLAVAGVDDVGVGVPRDQRRERRSARGG